ncbi:MAG TPA: cupin domain-containing protein [Rhizomicrobium sp.]|nr:cupin domain-containing protein [Rhizomicrobium sp.]
MPADTEMHEHLSPKTFASMRPEQVAWAQFEAFPPGGQLAVLVGDPSKAGPYVIRVKIPAGMKLPPHRHPEDRIYTVISGVFYIGHGEHFDEAGLTAYGPGSLVVLPSNTPHFHWARSGQYITQVYGTGPMGTHYVDSKDDPRNRR